MCVSPNIYDVHTHKHTEKNERFNVMLKCDLCDKEMGIILLLYLVTLYKVVEMHCSIKFAAAFLLKTHLL